MFTVKTDTKGRLLIPQELRTAMGIEAGDTFFVQQDADGRTLRFAKAENPFDALADEARRERAEGRTRGLRAFAAEQGIDLDAGE